MSTIGTNFKANYARANDLMTANAGDNVTKIAVGLGSFLAAGALTANGVANALGVTDPNELNAFTGPVAGLSGALAGTAAAYATYPIGLVIKCGIEAAIQTAAEGLGIIGREA